MLLVDAGAAQLDDFIPHRLEGGKIKLLRGVIIQIFRRIRARLQPVGADNLLRFQMLDEQMVADGIKRIGVQSGRVGLRQAFVEFEVEDMEAQRLRGLGAELKSLAGRRAPAAPTGEVRP